MHRYPTKAEFRKQLLKVLARVREESKKNPEKAELLKQLAWRHRIVSNKNYESTIPLKHSMQSRPKVQVEPTSLETFEAFPNPPTSRTGRFDDGIEEIAVV